jgi:hypothetical protein
MRHSTWRIDMDKPEFEALTRDMPQYVPPQFDAEVDQILDGFARLIGARKESLTSVDLMMVVRMRLQAAFMDGVIAALKERAREQGVDL